MIHRRVFFSTHMRDHELLQNPERTNVFINAYVTTATKSLQLCLTLCNPMDCSLPGFRPWDSPGKNTGVGCHFLLQSMKVESESEVPQSLDIIYFLF